MVLRMPSEKSRKHLALRLSPDGKKVLRRAKGPAQEAYERLLAPFSATQRKQLMQLLQLLSGSLNHEARATLKPLETDPTS